MKFHLIRPYYNTFCSISTAIFLSALLILALTTLSYYTNFHNAKQYTSSPSSSSSTTTTDHVVKNCNIFQGKWVPDPAAPYYNSTCSVIHQKENCIKNGRPDSGFLKWRWQPKECNLRRFDPARFLEVMRNKAMAFVGDSLARNHMQSLVCLLSQVEQPISRTKNLNYTYYNAYFKNYNFTISIFWSPFLVRAEEMDQDDANRTSHWNLYLDEPDDTWASHIATFDYLTISASSWFTRRSMFYEQGRLVGCNLCLMRNITGCTLLYSQRMALRTVLRAIIQGDIKFEGKVILRTLSPSHFENGEWDKGGACTRTRPYQGNETSLGGLELEFYRAQIEEFRAAETAAKAKAKAREKGERLMLMDTTEAMLVRPDAHPSRYTHSQEHQNATMYNDCVHWCLPGPVDVWNDMLFHVLLV